MIESSRIDDVPAAFDQPLGALQRHLGDLGVVLDRLVEGRGDDFAFDRAPHVGHFFRPLADEADHQVHVRVVGGDAVGDRLEQQRLAGLRRRDDQTALPPADRRDQVEQPGREDVRRASRGRSARAGRSASACRTTGRRRAVSGSTPLTASTRSRLKNFSLSFGGRT